jgi:uncharacterized protein
VIAHELAFEIAGGLVVGASLGLVGAGGAILCVPIFDVLLGHDAKSAVAEALVVTCVIALASTIGTVARGTLDWRRVVLMGVPGMMGAVAGGWLGGLLPDTWRMVMFALVALVAAWRMAASTPAAQERTTEPSAPHSPAAPHASLARFEMVLVGAGIGVLTGLVGVGGGFLLIPAMVLLLRMPMAAAVPTSLAIIALNSGVGFIGNRLGDAAELHADWQAVAVVAAFGVAGSMVGSRLAGRLPALLLRRIFAVVVVLIALLVVARQAGVLR